MRELSFSFRHLVKGICVVCILTAAILMSGLFSSCNSDDECPLNPEDSSQFVIVGFWSTSDCSGEPIAKNSFPVDSSEECYCWPGNSGENSADTFKCDVENKAFIYTQYGSLTCGEDDNTPTVKTVFTDQCKQDIPPTIYSRILEYDACLSTID